VLTSRETDVLRLLASGCSYAQIGARLGISIHTVTSHIKNSYRKLAVHTAAAAVTRAAALQLLFQPSCARMAVTQAEGVAATSMPIALAGGSSVANWLRRSEAGM